MSSAKRTLFKGKGRGKNTPPVIAGRQDAGESRVGGDKGGAGGVGDGEVPGCSCATSLSKYQEKHLTPRKIQRLLDEYDNSSGSDLDMSDDDLDDSYNPNTDTDIDDDVPSVSARARVKASVGVRGRGATVRGAQRGSRGAQRGRRGCRATRGNTGRGRRERSVGVHLSRERSEDEHVSPDQVTSDVEEGDAADEGDEGDEGWTQDPTPPTLLPFISSPGMIVPVPDTPLGFIQLFLTMDLLRFIMEETNSYANYCRNELRKKTSYNWVGCTIVDIANYLGIRIFMGMCKLPEENMYWRTECTRSLVFTPMIPNIMTLRRFKQLNTYFHCFNRKALPLNYFDTDRLMPVRTVMEYLTEKCYSLYMPESNLSLDEGTLAYKGRLSMKVYNPMKPDKYGIKFYVLCEAVSGYVLDFSIYSGTSQSLRSTVFGLCQRYFHLGYRVFVDNYYNSVELTEELYENGMHSCGTLRLPRGAPKSLKKLTTKKQARDSLQFRRKDNTFVICWQDVRLVSLITNTMGVDTEEYEHHKRVRKQGRSELQVTKLQRPQAIKEYIKYMRGVDRFDQMIKYYHFTRKTMKWTKKVVFYFFQIMLHNAHILYLKNTTDERKLTLLQFHEVACKALLYFDPDEWPENYEPLPHAASLPEDERYDRVPHDSGEEEDVDDPPPATATPVAAPTSATPAAASTPATPAAAAAATPATPAAATPATPAAVHGTPAPTPGPSATPRVKRPRYADAPARLATSKQLHTPMKVTGTAKNKRCRVCYLSGVRRDTTYQCCICNIPLCIKRDCFTRYHTEKRFWRSPTGAGQASAGQQ